MESENKKHTRLFGLSTASINNRMTVMVILVIMVIAGLVSYINMPRESFPEIVIPQIYVGTPYPGNSALDIEKLVTRPLEKEIGAIDILINNAGIIKRTPLVEMEVADFRQVIDVDLVSPFILSKHVVKGMMARKEGKIINICSMMSELGRNTVSAYAAAKGGLKMLTKNLATEWARHNIQVNGIGPGYFATIQTEPIRVDGHPFNEFIINRTPATRWGNPEDLEGAAVFLASKASDFVNGQIIYVDGGILATIGKPSNE